MCIRDSTDAVLKGAARRIGQLEDALAKQFNVKNMRELDDLDENILIEATDKLKGKTTKTKPTFEANEAYPYQDPRDYKNITFEGDNTVKNVDDLYSDTNALKEYATGKVSSAKELHKSIQKKRNVKKINDDPAEELAGSGPDYDDFASGGRVPLSKGKVVKGLAALMDEFFPGTTKVGQTSKSMAPKTELKRSIAGFQEREQERAKVAKTLEAMSKAESKMAGPIKTKKKRFFDPESTDHTAFLLQEKFFNPKALDMYGNKVPKNWIAKEKKDAQKLIDDLGPLDVSPNHPNYKDMKAIRQSAKDRLESIKITEALGGNIQMHDWLRMNRKNINIDDYIRKADAPVVKDELSGIKKAFVQKQSSPWYTDPKTLTPEEELRQEFPGIDDNLIKNILADDNPQRIAEVKAALKEALKMQEKGMGPDEIINIFKKKPTKHATGGRVSLSSGGVAGMLGE